MNSLETKDKKPLFYVYFLLDTRKEKWCYEYQYNDMTIKLDYPPFYVWKWKENRHISHFREIERKKIVEQKWNFHKKNIIKQIIDNNLPRLYYVYLDNLIEKEAFSLEIEMIKLFWRKWFHENWILVNMTDGWEWSVNCPNKYKWKTYLEVDWEEKWLKRLKNISWHPSNKKWKTFEEMYWKEKASRLKEPFMGQNNHNYKDKANGSKPLREFTKAATWKKWEEIYWPEKAKIMKINSSNAQKNHWTSEETRKKLSMWRKWKTFEELFWVKNAKWDKQDWLKVPRDVYNSYFYIVEDEETNVVDKFVLHWKEIMDFLDWGSALHLNLENYLNPEGYRTLINLAAKTWCNYFCTNTKVTSCRRCWHIDKKTLTTCPKCGSWEVDWATRIIWYLKCIKSFSSARQTEEWLRFYHDKNEDVKTEEKTILKS